MGPHAQLSGGHGRCGALRHVNASVLPPGGHELFVERGSPLAGFLTLSLGLGGSRQGSYCLPASVSSG